MQWVLLLMLNIDTMEAMDLLSLTHQTSVDIPPYYITYNLRKAKQMITDDIQSLKELLSLLTNLRINQFDVN